MGAAGPWAGGCQTQRVYQVGLLGPLLNDAFVTFITPRMRPRGMVAAR